MIPPGVVVVALGRAVLFDRLPAAMLEVDSGLFSLGREADLDLGGDSVTLEDVPSEHDARRRLPAEHRPPVTLLAFCGDFVDLSAFPFLEEDLLHPVPVDRVRVDRPPADHVRGEDAESLLDHAVHGDRLAHGFDDERVSLMMLLLSSRPPP